MRNAVPCSLGEIGKSAVGSATICELLDAELDADGRALVLAHRAGDDDRRLLLERADAAKTSSETSALETTACTMPVPSRTCRK